ncbi:hypothetical protein B0T25DRAFT_568937 [Lasiosphaeria hispida]|uniref:Uncharacterized protein n=1 Tax=Lasiosphaeria hispida TaxID=260671 RepID=A0AAJ0HJM1_9PEZI|nr:hypothetical protein B0T25DRAFT_568937 [Lasiosphaeria hispida]
MSTRENTAGTGVGVGGENTTRAAPSAEGQVPAYVPGRGPPLPALGLTLPRVNPDSLAFIIDSFERAAPIAGDLAGLTHPEKCYYLGWTNDSERRAIVSYKAVFNYVSPDAVERWEAGVVDRRAVWYREEEADRQRLGAAVQAAPRMTRSGHRAMMARLP